MERGCPEGMYPVDFDFVPNEYDSFEEFKKDAEETSNILNLPISWFFAEEESTFELAFAMPRKGLQTFGMILRNYDREKVQAWLDTWLKQEIHKWFGWE